MLRLWCLVEGCLGVPLSRTNLRIYFAHRHVRDKFLILDEINQPYPMYLQCKMFVFPKSLNYQHLAMDFFQWVIERIFHRLAE